MSEEVSEESVNERTQPNTTRTGESAAQRVGESNGRGGNAG